MIFFVCFRFLALKIWEKRCFEDFDDKDELMNQLFTWSNVTPCLGLPEKSWETRRR